MSESDMSKYTKVVSDPTADYRAKPLEVYHHLFRQSNKVVQKHSEAKVLLEVAVDKLKQVDADSESTVKQCEDYEQVMLYLSTFFMHIPSVMVGTTSLSIGVAQPRVMAPTLALQNILQSKGCILESHSHLIAYPLHLDGLEGMLSSFVPMKISLLLGLNGKLSVLHPPSFSNP
ncbi:hypothetical protein BC830DRAFT_220083 [Chytriomyces sp. MP71]|nr:hypothetical protein BC830DRAFT_220083 [Chytriomyces sp. MP71]